jgi:rhodanese-related sulfurtransferase
MTLTSPVPHSADQELTQLLSGLPVRKMGGLAYSGDIQPEDAYSFLQNHKAMLIDVRTLPEWQFTGVPDLAQTQGTLATICWKFYPDFSLNAKFADQVNALPDINTDTPLFFLCRTGGRSLDAAVAMTAAGYRHCFNVSGGFEGETDAQGHRGATQGWKAKKLPWKQG